MHDNKKLKMGLISSITKPRDFNVIVIVLLLSSSITSLIAHRFGLMDTSLNLQSSELFTNYSTLSVGGVEGTISLKDGKLQAECTYLPNNNNEYKNCGISIGYGHLDNSGVQDITQGLDLTKYDRISLKVTYESPSDEDRVKFSFRNYSPSYSQPDDYVSLKFNSIVYSVGSSSTYLTLPLKTFKVEDWWIDDFKIDFLDSQIDFSNIVFVELLSHQMNVPGDYLYRIESATLHGELLTELELLQIIFAVFLLTIILLVYRQSKIMERVSKTDSLTELYNRRGIETIISKECQSKKYSDAHFFYFDVDGFKAVNDTHGHQIGDHLLIKIAEIIFSLSHKVAENKAKFSLARLGGDEFCVLINDVDEKQAIDVAQKIIELLSLPMEIDRRLIKVGVSVGIVKMEPRHNSFAQILEEADTAMYVAKKEGKNCYRFFNEKVKTVIYESKRIATELKTALDKNQMELVYMPIVDANSQQVKKAEVLLRTNNDGLKDIGPDIFIPIAEEFGIIQRIDLWVLENAMKFIENNLQIIKQSKLVIAINISSKEMNNLAFYSNFKLLLERYNVPPSCLELEITETSFSEVDQMSIEVLSKIRGLGVSLSLDDFGTGYSAFQHIELYPVDSLKIDKSFIDKYQSKKASDRTIITAMIGIAHSHGLTVVAEGVESKEQSDYLKQHHCDLLQGYYFSKPLHQHVFIELLNAQR
ncbi:bifunctional diguanylate cyclase/phosphodiesterase [Glaciecola sp. KUL10]|uniref:putative bifunctional diguanylate cyclase/phosphodiesterase n=1 Tax=Glaciecola sp. (strain KUL10) TaxID=2161813 RepID=UPI000D7851F5|nr:bifunctional diguanylate cyclase/phosphodiesterase [Glaciecola sp. KUL10]